MFRPPPNANINGGPDDTGNAASANSSSPSFYVPTDEHIDLLQAMGFTRSKAIQSLRESRGNLELAANRLINSEY
jgi:hypothetical protein